MAPMPTTEQLAQWVPEARARSLELIADLDDEALTVPYLPTINPLLWELCHLAHFQEFWILREGAGQEPWQPDVDQLFDSIHIAHETRWRLPMPSRRDALAYVEGVRDRVMAVVDGGLENGVHDRLRYLITYSVFHEDMHTEALTYTRQTLGYPAPQIDMPRHQAPSDTLASATPEEDKSVDIDFAGGEFQLGAAPETEFCFDNEKWAHPVSVEPFAMARTAITEGQFAAFILDGGYDRRSLWSPVGWAAVQAEGSTLPVYWRRAGKGFERRHFDEWLPIESGRAMIHVSWYEADAWCRWAKRRLPTEAEWEFAASLREGGVVERNLDWSAMGPANVHAGEDAGCRQLIGNVWEWTSSTFRPYPGFTPDMYEDYSQSSFETRKVLRGGCWATRERLISNTWRNYFQPTRRDVFAGFRTCAL